MGYTWKTEMRASATTARTDKEAEARTAARAADRLHGQAAARRLDDGRWQFTVMPDAQSFMADATISRDDAVRLAHAILDADRHPMEAKAVARVEIIDLTQQAIDLAGGDLVLADEQFRAIHGRPLAAHDYRFRGNPRPDERQADVTYGALYIARDIAHAIEQDSKLKAQDL